MATIPLGDGVVDIPGVLRELHAAGFSGPTTLEIAGAGAVKTSVDRLTTWNQKIS
jgi:sugar phosphate isomerase/epimerase